MTQPHLSIIIPAYQEAGRIERTLDQLAAFLHSERLEDTEVIVAVAASSDGTADLATAKRSLFSRFRVIHTGPQIGKGRDVRSGVLEAKGKFRLFMDADLATPLHHIQEILPLLEQGADVVIAVRNLTQTHTGMRLLISNGGNWLVRSVLLPGIKDTQCGFKAFTAEAAEELFCRQTILGWGFDMEILAIARMYKMRIDQVEVRDWSDQPNSTFEDAVAGAAMVTLGELVMILYRRWTGGYRNKRYAHTPLSS